MAYPGSLDSFLTKTDGVDDVMAADVNGLQSAIVAIETELGTDPAASATDLVTRLSVSLDAYGSLSMTAATTLTISSGVIAVSQNYHRIETQSGASTDDLDTISGTTNEGFILVIRALNGSHNVVIKHNTGNINNVGAIDITLDNAFDFAILIYDATMGKWICMSSTVIAGAATLAGNNTWTGTNSWSAAVAYKYTATSTGITLDATHYMVNVDASGAARTITLPTAVGITGRHYIIRKSDSSANAVTVDGDGSETINGALTHVMTAQYQTVSIMSDGAGWMIL